MYAFLLACFVLLQTYQLSKVGVLRYCFTSSETSRELEKINQKQLFYFIFTLDCKKSILGMSPHLEELFPDVLTLFAGLAQGSFMVERGGLVGVFWHVFKQSQPAQVLNTLKRKTSWYRARNRHVLGKRSFCLLIEIVKSLINKEKNNKKRKKYKTHKINIT